MAKYVCTVCGYVHEGDSAPERCPVCNATTFKEVQGEMSWACEHIVGSAKNY
ncbi:MAG: NADH peroxidase, partial [Clostridia bacterium]|nr:NADH peroxidase [Clostridia bacterium]